MAVLPNNNHVKSLECFKPYKRADGRVITSQVSKDTKEWYDVQLLVPHEPIRRDMIEVDYLLTHHVKPDEAWKLVNFFSWYNVRFINIIHGHHDAEEHVFFPAISKRVNIPEKTSADHKTLMKGLDELTALGEQFKALGQNEIASRKVLPLLRAKWHEVLEMMLPHLAEEEEQMLEIKNHFTKAEVDAITQTILKEEGLSGARLFLPSIVESLHMWGNQDNLNEMATHLPFPIRMMLRYFWFASYQKYHRGVLDSLYSGAPKKVIIEKTGFFAW